jgi:hypothetical protein
LVDPRWVTELRISSSPIVFFSIYLIYSLILSFTFPPSSFSHFAYVSVSLYLHLLHLVITSLSRNVLLQSSTDYYTSHHPYLLIYLLTYLLHGAESFLRI